MKLLLANIGAVALAVFLFSFANVFAGDNNNGNLTDDSDQSDYYNDYYKTHSHEGVDDSESNIDDINLKTRCCNCKLVQETVASDVKS